MVRPKLPDPIAAGEVIGTLDPTQAALFVVIFVLIAVFVFVAFREMLNWKLAKSLDKMSEALVSLRIVIETAIVRGEEREKVRDEKGRK